MNPRSFPAKLLLFGEYTVLSGSRAFAIPLGLWSGRLESGGNSPDPDLDGLCRYLEDKHLFDEKDLGQFHEAIAHGLRFVSDIPTGTGVGSSGALCAAVYAGFCSHPSSDLTGLRQSLAIMEGHFHGTSSGMDPLVSYTGSPILHEQQTYHAIPPVKWPGDLQVCLIDSGMTRATGELVRQYLEWSNDETFASNCTRPLIQSVDHVISFLLDGHLPALLEHLHLISTLQYKYFRPMITENLLDVWERSFDSDFLDIKLCGAGGGGYYLAFVRGDSGIETLRQWTSCPVIPVPVVQI